MAKTVIGLFDNRAEAQNVVQELMGVGFRRDDISVMSKKIEGQDRQTREGEAVAYVEEDGEEQIKDMAKGAGTGAAIGGLAGLLVSLTALAIPGIGPVLAAGPLAAVIAGAGIGATAGGLISGLTRLGVPEDDANYYAEGVRRGGTLISVEASDDKAESAVAIMKQHGAVEIDKRAAQWRDEGWSGFDSNATETAYNTFAGGGQQASAPASEVTAEHQRPSAPRAAAQQGQVAVPVVEEQLQVGKREVERGGVRVETHVTEKPVEENVELREEHVNVERRPVDYTFHGTESEAFKESLVEIREAYEELVVNKKARVVEEVVVNKDVEQHTETVRETLRRTDVNVEPIDNTGKARGASASSQKQQGDDLLDI
ncbi:MAG TPA: YsnF/AvaK domain-containing protein [Pyrinomonadaceae bacterium]|nr:YsnF/AvaK domain-containing protein [Pyrinomonadaceae bacterium]